MVIQVNTEFLLNNHISPNQFIIIQLVLEENYRTLNRLSTHFPNFVEEIDKLISIGVLDKISRINKLVVTEQFKNQLLGEDLFEELLALYPSNVIRKDGKKEYLKTDLRRSKNRYKVITNNRVDLHEHILKCLQVEITTRTANNSMMYFRKIYNWLNAEGWKDFEPQLNDSTMQLS